MIQNNQNSNWGKNIGIQKHAGKLTSLETLTNHITLVNPVTLWTVMNLSEIKTRREKIKQDQTEKKVEKQNETRNSMYYHSKKTKQKLRKL